MLSTKVTTLVLLASVFAQEAAAAYGLVDEFSQGSFFEGFDFWTDKDPTSGYVTFKSFAEAASSQIIGYGNGSVLIGVDSKNKATSGRSSVRLTSRKSYHHGLLVADIKHMPGGACGAWPALWMTGAQWPQDGEIDIIEGVNHQASNAMTLHTADGCVVDDTIAATRRISSVGGGDKSNIFTGNMTTSNCYVDATNQGTNAGCQIMAPLPNAPLPADVTSPTSRLFKREAPKTAPATYGTSFNQQGGGVYAMEWTSTSINVWFFPRNAIPAELSTSNPSPTPGSSWGTPIAAFSGGGCDFDARFSNLSIVIDTTFCGDWAGNPDLWKNQGCAQSTGVDTCDSYVAQNPLAFVDAYWEFASLRYYQDNGAAAKNKTAVKRKTGRFHSHRHKKRGPGGRSF